MGQIKGKMERQRRKPWVVNEGNNDMNNEGNPEKLMGSSGGNGNNEGNKGEENGKQCVGERKTTGKEYGEPWEGQWEENGKNSMEK